MKYLEIQSPRKTPTNIVAISYTFNLNYKMVLHWNARYFGINKLSLRVIPLIKNIVKEHFDGSNTL